jgi:methionyl-tRNA formyltransferase
MGLIDFSQDAVAVERHIRAMNPWPSSYATFRGKQMKLWEAYAVSPHNEQSSLSVFAYENERSAGTISQGEKLNDSCEVLVKSDPNDPPGTIFHITADSFYVSCGSGALAVTQVQIEGKRRMSVADFLKGASLSASSRERLYGK